MDLRQHLLVFMLRPPQVLRQLFHQLYRLNCIISDPQALHLLQHFLHIQSAMLLIREWLGDTSPAQSHLRGGEFGVEGRVGFACEGELGASSFH